MAHVFLCTLGTGRYEPVQYQMPWQASPAPQADRFVQASIVKSLISQGEEPDRVDVLGTVQAKETHFTALSDALQAAGLTTPPTFHVIPAGATESDTGEILDILSKLVDEGDEVTLDITHGFRSQPLIVSEALLYLVNTSNCRLNAIYYGAYIPNQSDARVLNLEPIARLREWAEAYANFQRSGDVSSLARLVGYNVREVGQALQAQTPRAYRALAQALGAFGKALRYGDIREVPASARKAVEAMKAILDMEKPSSTAHALDQAVLTVLSDLNATLSPFVPPGPDPTDDVISYARLAQWCDKVGLMPQAAIFLREGLVDLLSLGGGLRPADRAADRLFGMASAHAGGTPITVEERQRYAWPRLMAQPWFEEAAALASRLKNFRNGVLHGWMRRPQSPGTPDVRALSEGLHQLAQKVKAS